MTLTDGKAVDYQESLSKTKHQNEDEGSVVITHCFQWRDKREELSELAPVWGCWILHVTSISRWSGL